MFLFSAAAIPWILLPLAAIILGSVFSSRHSEQWTKSLAMVVVAVGGSIILLSSLTASLHTRQLSIEQSHSPVKYETYVARPVLAR